MFVKYAKVTGHCLVTGKNGMPAQVLTNRIGIYNGDEDGLASLDIDGMQALIPYSMIEILRFPKRGSGKMGRRWQR